MDNFSEIKKQMQRSEENLTSFACLSSDAIREKSEKEDIRLEFERDVDKIIHSSTYTRYIDKTQVYSDIENDNISRRITHVQFVSRAARTIARALGVNEDLCEAISLGHDVGHTPYGHAGERILNKISKEKIGKTFAHNLNSVRMFTKIENGGNGCNLTLQVLDGIMCHNGEMLQNKYAPVKKDLTTLKKEYEACLDDEKNNYELFMDKCRNMKYYPIRFVNGTLIKLKNGQLVSDYSIECSSKEFPDPSDIIYLEFKGIFDFDFKKNILELKSIEGPIH